jgi:hypothetical protein
VTVPPDADSFPDDLPGEPGWAVVPVIGTQVELTSLGKYHVRTHLLAEGADAPLPEPSR